MPFFTPTFTSTPTSVPTPDPTPNPRIFYPSHYFLGPPSRLATLEQPTDIIHHITTYSPHTGITHLVINNLKAKRRLDRTLTIDQNSILVSVDGFCNDGKASFAIWFGRGSKLNLNDVVEETRYKSGLSRDLALLRATDEALRVAWTQLSTLSPTNSASPSPISPTSPVDDRPEKKTIVILTDSHYLVRCMSDWVLVWENQGFRNLKGDDVCNHKEIKHVGDLCKEIEGFGGEVRFWLVERGGVEDARRGAEGILEGGGMGES